LGIGRRVSAAALGATDFVEELSAQHLISYHSRVINGTMRLEGIRKQAFFFYHCHGCFGGIFSR